MIDIQHAKSLQIIGQIPKMLKQASFSRQQSLWVKDKMHPSLDGVQLSKKYQFTKKGKTFGIQVTRFLSLCQDHLFYFDEAESNEILGYCSLQNVYIQWFQLKNNNFLLIISNANELSEFYFTQQTFWNQQRKKLAKFTVMLNFYQQFEILDELGEGSFAKVYRVRDYDTKIEYAAKIISKGQSTSALQMITEEKRILSALQDSNYIYQFKQFHETNNEQIILMEYITGVDLMSFIRMKLELSISDIKYLLTNILMGIKDCHDNKIIHRDIKPQNIMVDVHTLQIKIIDFGLSLQLPDQSSKCNLKKCGTIGYMAPEIFECKKKGYNQKCDIFSFGIIAHLLLLGSNPLKGKTYEQTCMRNQACKIKLNQAQIIEKYGENGLIFFKKILSVSSQQRYTAQQALMNPFLRDINGKASVTTDDDKMRGSFD